MNWLTISGLTLLYQLMRYSFNSALMSSTTEDELLVAIESTFLFFFAGGFPFNAYAWIETFSLLTIPCNIALVANGNKDSTWLQPSMTSLQSSTKWFRPNECKLEIRVNKIVRRTSRTNVDGRRTKCLNQNARKMKIMRMSERWREHELIVNVGEVKKAEIIFLCTVI